MSCGVGYYCPADGTHEQSPCPIGWYTTSPGSSTCQQCERGKPANKIAEKAVERIFVYGIAY